MERPHPVPPQLEDALNLFEKLRHTYGWNDVDIALALATDEPNLRRLAASGLPLTHGTRAVIADLQDLVLLLRDIFPNAKDAQRWLNDPAAFPMGKSPIDLIRHGQLDEVVSVLATFRARAFL